MWDLWWTVWRWHRGFSERFRFPLSVSYQLCCCSYQKDKVSKPGNWGALDRKFLWSFKGLIINEGSLLPVFVGNRWQTVSVWHCHMSNQIPRLPHLPEVHSQNRLLALHWGVKFKECSYGSRNTWGPDVFWCSASVLVMWLLHAWRIVPRNVCYVLLCSPFSRRWRQRCM
jgi:hypothetical protein